MLSVKYWVMDEWDDGDDFYGGTLLNRQSLTTILLSALFFIWILADASMFGGCVWVRRRIRRHRDKAKDRRLIEAAAHNPSININTDSMIINVPITRPPSNSHAVPVKETESPSTPTSRARVDDDDNYGVYDKPGKELTKLADVGTKTPRPDTPDLKSTQLITPPSPEVQGFRMFGHCSSLSSLLLLILTRNRPVPGLLVRALLLLCRHNRVILTLQ